ncbi:hypothetical protein BOTBODRAFT_146227 [Botryobasidium botryosum FD-172 SS1]|uniref:Uncharacterized protein n=1 Tax=Botryobasidium botryosum (strain FD-172 SS1) TaxID=930990 RepID=A0A067MCV0_BOTB1|nr:hypothetical protein BOTBODRAFT_146227 [Botryobasidium botryosum FD-172 SS1]
MVQIEYTLPKFIAYAQGIENGSIYPGYDSRPTAKESSDSILVNAPSEARDATNADGCSRVNRMQTVVGKRLDGFGMWTMQSGACSLAGGACPLTFRRFRCPRFLGGETREKQGGEPVDAHPRSRGTRPGGTTTPARNISSPAIQFPIPINVTESRSSADRNSPIPVSVTKSNESRRDADSPSSSSSSVSHVGLRTGPGAQSQPNHAQVQSQPPAGLSEVSPNPPAQLHRTASSTASSRGANARDASATSTSASASASTATTATTATRPTTAGSVTSSLPAPAPVASANNNTNTLLETMLAETRAMRSEIEALRGRVRMLEEKDAEKEKEVTDLRTAVRDAEGAADRVRGEVLEEVDERVRLAIEEERERRREEEKERALTSWAEGVNGKNALSLQVPMDPRDGEDLEIHDDDSDALRTATTLVPSFPVPPAPLITPIATNFSPPEKPYQEREHNTPPSPVAPGGFFVSPKIKTKPIPAPITVSSNSGAFGWFTTNFFAPAPVEPVPQPDPRHSIASNSSGDSTFYEASSTPPRHSVLLDSAPPSPSRQSRQISTEVIRNESLNALSYTPSPDSDSESESESHTPYHEPRQLSMISAGDGDDDDSSDDGADDPSSQSEYSASIAIEEQAQRQVVRARALSPDGFLPSPLDSLISYVDDEDRVAADGDYDLASPVAVAVQPLHILPAPPGGRSQALTQWGSSSGSGSDILVRAHSSSRKHGLLGIESQLARHSRQLVQQQQGEAGAGAGTSYRDAILFETESSQGAESESNRSSYFSYDHRNEPSRKESEYARGGVSGGGVGVGAGAGAGAGVGVGTGVGAGRRISHRPMSTRVVEPNVIPELVSRLDELLRHPPADLHAAFSANNLGFFAQAGGTGASVGDGGDEAEVESREVSFISDMGSEGRGDEGGGESEVDNGGGGVREEVVHGDKDAYMDGEEGGDEDVNSGPVIPPAATAPAPSALTTQYHRDSDSRYHFDSSQNGPSSFRYAVNDGVSPSTSSREYPWDMPAPSLLPDTNNGNSSTSSSGGSSVAPQLALSIPRAGNEEWSASTTTVGGDGGTAGRVAILRGVARMGSKGSKASTNTMSSSHSSSPTTTSPLSNDKGSLHLSRSRSLSSRSPHSSLLTAVNTTANPANSTGSVATAPSAASAPSKPAAKPTSSEPEKRNSDGSDTDVEPILPDIVVPLPSSRVRGKDTFLGNGKTSSPYFTQESLRPALQTAMRETLGAGAGGKTALGRVLGQGQGHARSGSAPTISLGPGLGAGNGSTGVDRKNSRSLPAGGTAFLRGAWRDVNAKADGSAKKGITALDPFIDDGEPPVAPVSGDREQPTAGTSH